MRTVAIFSVLVPALILAAAGCGGDGGGPDDGDLQVSISASGVDTDFEPFMVSVDGSASRAVTAGSSTTFTNLDPGSHIVRLDDMAENCQVSGTASKTVSVVGGQQASCSFSVSCDAVVSGTWGYSLSIDLGVPCTITENLSLVQTNSSFGGSATGGWIRCPLGDVDESFAGAAVRDGVTNQSHVEFDFDNSLIHHTGSYSGSRMTGTVVFQFPEGNVSGSWSATRTSGLVLDRKAPFGEVVQDGAASLHEIAERIRRKVP